MPFIPKRWMLAVLSTDSFAWLTQKLIRKCILKKYSLCCFVWPFIFDTKISIYTFSILLFWSIKKTQFAKRKIYYYICKINKT